MAMSDPTDIRRMEGASVLVVEDETMIALLIEDMLIELGCRQVWHAGGVAEAMIALDTHRPDIAMLDVNLSRELVYPVAERLLKDGTPFVFATGYGWPVLPPAVAGKPLLHKPFSVEALGTVLADELARFRGGPSNGLRRA
jgi:CheY-like chemotaxis protein